MTQEKTESTRGKYAKRRDFTEGEWSEHLHELWRQQARRQWARHKETISAKRRERYATDPEYRRRRIEICRRSYLRHNEAARARREEDMAAASIAAMEAARLNGAFTPATDPDDRAFQQEAWERAGRRSSVSRLCERINAWLEECDPVMSTNVTFFTITGAPCVEPLRLTAEVTATRKRQ